MRLVCHLKIISVLGLFPLTGCQTLPWQTVDDLKQPRKVSIGGQAASPDLLAKVKAQEPHEDKLGNDQLPFVKEQDRDQYRATTNEPTHHDQRAAAEHSHSSDLRQAGWLQPTALGSPQVTQNIDPAVRNRPPQPAKKTPHRYSPDEPRVAARRPSKGTSTTSALKVAGITKDRNGRGVAILKTKAGQTVLVKPGEQVVIPQGGSQKLVVSQIFERVVELTNEATQEVISVR